MADLPYSETLTHCTSSQGNKPLKATDDGWEPRVDNKITFTADPGYSFTKNGQYVITKVPENAYGHGPTTRKIIPTDPKIFTITITTTQSDVDDGYGNHSTYSLTLEATQDVTVPTIRGFTNIYNPTQTDLNALASERYLVPAGEEKFKIYDYGQFITNLISIPFKIPTELIDKVDNIQLGNKKLNATSAKLNNHLLSIDIGSIKVVGKYQNLFDYKNVKCKIYCPYIDPIDIDVISIMDKTLKINYLLDFYTGQANITITNSDNKIVYTDIKKISNDMPFIQISNNVIGKQQDAFFDNGIRKAYVEIIRNIPILNDKGYPTLERGKLKDYTGYIEVSNISLSTNASEQEQQEIQNKLRSGVNIL